MTERSLRAFRQDTDPEGRRLPIKLDSTSNGEFMPVPLWPANRTANVLAHEYASAFAKKLSLGPRAQVGPAKEEFIFDDVNFLIYHSGFVTGVEEEAYAADAKRDGIDTLIRSLEEVHGTRCDQRRAHGLPRGSFTALPHLRAEDAPGFPRALALRRGRPMR